MLSLGIDTGTSGIRAVIMAENHEIMAQAQCSLPQSTPLYTSGSQLAQQIIGYSQDPDDWWLTLEKVIFQLAETLLNNHQLQLEAISHLAIDGTSGTVLLCDSAGQPVSPALMYNDQRAVQAAELIQCYAPDNTAAIGRTSGLAKLLWLYQQHENVHYALNQSDWLSGKLLGRFGLSDHNNALKMGYDALNHCWPDWLKNLLQSQNIPLSLLPEVFTPGTVIGKISPPLAKHFGFHPALSICAGTTDSTAAIMASGAKHIGEAITSLGSTLVMKVIAEQPIFDSQSGVYSQPYGDLWLVGGSSNSGGEVLKQFFSQQQLNDFTISLQQQIKSGNLNFLNLGYYPLSSPGERFPVQDPALTAKFHPHPGSELDFFQAILEGMADIEHLAYQKLLDLGAPYPKHVTSIGGGALNTAWRYIRQQKLGVEVIAAKQQQAAAGAALLAQSSWFEQIDK